MRTLTVLLVAAFTAAAQSPARDWNQVTALSPGTGVRIERAGAASARGQLRSANGESMVVDSGKGPETIAREQVTLVSVKGKSHRVRNTLIGLAAGAAVGLGVGAGTRCTGFCIISNTVATSVLTIAGALVGGITGAVIPTGRWHVIYKQ